MVGSSKAAALFIVLLSVGTAMSQPQELVDRFERRSYTLDGFTLNYRLFVPNGYDAANEYPIVLALHGSGERGFDNESHIASHRMATAWADSAAQARHPAFVVAPQAPGSGEWSANIPPGDVRPEMATIYAILDSLSTEFHLDPNRIYVTGLSMGGWGTYEAVYHTPDRFAAAVEMSGGYLPSRAPGLEDVPFWILHGENDDQVPAFLDREMVTALEETGRDALYTHCGAFSTCEQLSDAALLAALRTHPNLIYTGLPGEGHVIWAPWYDNRMVQDWLFAQHRLVADGLQIEQPAPVGGSDAVSIMWSASVPYDSVEIWFRTQPDAEWLFVDRVGDDTAYELAVGSYPDLPLAQARLFLIDNEGFVVARAESERFSVNADGDGSPYVLVRDFPFRSGTPFTGSHLHLSYFAADAESDSLDLAVTYSPDAGESFELVHQERISGSNVERAIEIDLEPLANSPRAMFRIEASDGSNTIASDTPILEKWTPRTSASDGEHTAGRSAAEIDVLVIAADQLTGHRYRVEFGISDLPGKTYSIRDLDINELVLSGLAVNGAESPVFDGLRLLVHDIERATVDGDSSGWSSESVNLGVAVSAPRVNIGGQSRQLLATPADYVLTIDSEVVDTSSTLFGFPARDMRFVVTNEIDGGRRDVLFADPDGNGYPDPGETLYIVETDGNDEPFPGWLLSFTGIAGTVRPEPGDSFSIVTRKPITADDVFEFVGALSPVSTESGELPDGFSLGQNYPNPFAGQSTVSFSIPRPDNVRLVLYDALGRRVMSLADAPFTAGEHRLTVDGRDLPSGIYFYRLLTDAVALTRKMLVVH